MFDKIFNFFFKEKKSKQKCITVMGERREQELKEIRKQTVVERSVLVRNDGENIIDCHLSIYFNNAFNLFRDKTSENHLSERLMRLSSQR